MSVLVGDDPGFLRLPILGRRQWFRVVVEPVCVPPDVLVMVSRCVIGPHERRRGCVRMAEVPTETRLVSVAPIWCRDQ